MWGVLQRPYERWPLRPLLLYKDGAKLFIGKYDELAATGFQFPTPNLDDVPWAQAARAATGFCRKKGFSGGFMNGHQLPGIYGVVCQINVDPAPWARKGEEIAEFNRLVGAIRDKEPFGPQQTGFNIGMGLWQGSISDGPIKQVFAKPLTPAGQLGFADAATFSFQWNNNADLAARGGGDCRTKPPR